jgi:fibro-slime domain-containing protein
LAKGERVNEIRKLALPFAAALLVASCGARTEPELPEPCPSEGDSRPCENVCGTGVSECIDGFWQACEVERTEHECENECGNGVAECVDGEWGACRVASRTEACTTACGNGTRVCEDGRFGKCDVPVTTRSCQDECGTGEQACRDGAWGTCEVPRVAVFCQSVCGAGEEICENGRWAPCNAPLPKPPKLQTTIRDFHSSHPDFEIRLSGDLSETGIVDRLLGEDDKPVYVGTSSITTSGRENFDQWYRDVNGVNQTGTFSLELSVSPTDPSLFVYDDRQFFPIDGQLFGNEGRFHNFHFTLEAQTIFQYIGGEVFRFRGDDDMWVFINRRLAIDLGGIHGAKRAEVDLDAHASELEIEIGETYPLHFFFAERHTFESNFTIETSIAEPGSCE